MADGTTGRNGNRGLKIALALSLALNLARRVWWPGPGFATARRIAAARISALAR
ncbi:hypothetical protein MASR1M32_15800 [Rhodobacter sp.]